MAEIKFNCPSCGAHLIADEKAHKIDCPYCGNVYVEAEFRDDIINSRYKSEIEKAAKLRNSCDFEEAHDLLDNLLSEDAKNPEIYFQMLLLDYGISYVDENEKIREVPIFNYIKKDPMSKNQYYNKLFESIGTNEIKQKSYKNKIDELEKLRQKVYETYSKDEPYQVFISFKKSDIENPTLRTRDLEIARRLYEKFTKEFHLKVFFSEETLKNVAGTEFEPHIFSALYSAKVFLLICGSPDKPEYIRSPWIKSEWERFAKRYDEEIDNRLALIPVFSNGYTESYLPRRLQRFEGYELNEEFYENMRKVFANVLVGSKKSQFQSLNISTKVTKLKTNKETITLRGFSGHKEQDLVDFEKTDFEVALANMKAGSKKDFANAYAKLERITQTNPYNYEANLAKLKCDFSIPFEGSLVNASLRGIKRSKYSQISKDFMSTLSVASDEDRERIVEAFIIIIDHFLQTDLKGFLDMLDSDDDLLLTVVSVVDKEKMLDIIQTFEGSFKLYFKAYSPANVTTNIRDWRKNRTLYDKCLFKVFKKYYSNYDEKGAKLIINLMTYISRKAILVKDYDYADKLMKEILDINEFDIPTLWAKFLNSTTRSTNVYGEDTIRDLVVYLTNKNFVIFPLSEELPNLEKNKTNLYYFIVKMITGGAKLNLTNEKSPFYVIFQVAMRMFNQKKKVELSKQIIKAFTQMAESANASSKEINYILMRSANRLLLEKQYAEATIYYNEVLAKNPNDEDALWGLMKCEAKCPSNYSLIFYKKDLSDLSSFRNVITCFKKNHPDSPTNPFLDYYSGMRNIASSKRKDILKAFKYFNEKLMDEDDPIDDSPAIILSLVQSNKLVTQMKEEIANLQSNPNSATSGAHSRSSANVKGCFIGFSILIALQAASIVLFHPLIAAGVSLVLCFLASIIFENKSIKISKKIANMFAIIYTLSFVAAVFFGRFWIIKDQLLYGDDYFFLFTLDSKTYLLLYPLIATGLVVIGPIFSLIKWRIKDSIAFSKFSAGIVLRLTFSYLFFAAYILAGGFIPLIALIALGLINLSISGISLYD